MIPICPQPGIHAIVFTVKEVLDGWADETQELVMDSTCMSFHMPFGDIG
jgi:hypothetical protein